MFGTREPTNKQILQELADFFRFSSVSSDTFYAGAIRDSTEWLSNHLRLIGLNHVTVLPTNIAALLNAHLVRVTPAGLRIRLRTLLSTRPAKMTRNHPAMTAAAMAYRTGPVYLRSGGSIPVVGLIQDILHIPVVLMGFGLPDDHIHGSNERLHLPTFFRGIETRKHFLLEAAKIKQPLERSA